MPAPLARRCCFVRTPQPVCLSIAIGVDPLGLSGSTLCGDARRGHISVGTILPDTNEPPSAIECFLVAGYLGFAVLARLAGIPPHHEQFTMRALEIPCDHAALYKILAEVEGFTCVGLGQLGQVFLALLFFLFNGELAAKRLVLVDRDVFESENGRTQILLPEGANWLNEPKVDFVSSVLKSWSAKPEIVTRRIEIQWGWNKAAGDPDTALIGLDDFEVRRMAIAAGFSRVIEAGVGTDFLAPRVSWHVVPGIPQLGRKLFPDREAAKVSIGASDWVDELKSTPGSCGWVRFNEISATAPSMGLVACAYALSELGRDSGGISGRALLWSPCIPIIREPISP